MTGREVGRYQFRERLGAGGMAMVYKAYDTRLEREVAIKVIQTDVFAPNVLEEVLQRFEREAKALARLNHPHIVKVYDFGEFDNQPYLVMEYHAGGTLKRYTDQPQSFHTAANLLVPVAKALDYAHQRNILHRDVKPSNILMNDDDQPMLTDFGIAKILEAGANTGLTASGVGIGTPEYIAPEQGLGHGADPRSDLYSLGIVFYELITGRRPFTADTPMAVILEHVTRPLPSPRDFVPELPEEVVAALYTALAKQPEDRYASMGVFASVLEQLASERPTARSLLSTPPVGITPARKISSGATAAQAGSLPYDAVQPTAQTPAPTPSAGVQGDAIAVGPTADGAGGEQQTVRQPMFRGAAQVAPQPRGGNVWLAIGIVLVVAVLATIGGLLMRGRGATPEPTQAVEASAMVSAATTNTRPPATHTANPTITLTPKPSATITPLPSPTALPQFISDEFNLPLALIPAAEVNLGSEDNDPSGNANEHPQTTIRLASFYLDVHEVTNEDYTQCVAAGKCQSPTSTGSSTSASYYDNPEFAAYPVIFVSWTAASDYCKWRKARLPTEAEWEAAARGGLPGQPYPWGEQPPTCESQSASGANYAQCPYSGPVPVGGFSANAYGLYDMAGNVWEWTSSLFRPYPYNPDDGREDPDPVELRVLRGGSWDAEAPSLRSAARRALNQNAVDNGIGFRCAVDIAVIIASDAVPTSQPAGGDQSSTGNTAAQATASRTPTPSNTPVSYTSTPNATATNTPKPAATNTPPPAATNTPPPPTNTPAPTPTYFPPTNTPAATNTPPPAPTSTPAATNTPPPAPTPTFSG